MSGFVLPENVFLRDSADAVIRNNTQAVVDSVHKFRDALSLRGVSLLPVVPLRPFFLSRKMLEQVAQVLFDLAVRGRDLLLREYRNGSDISMNFGIPGQFINAVDFDSSLTAAHFLASMRPDGFLFDDYFSVNELNIGNGVLISVTYAEVLHDYWSSFSPLSQFLRSTGNLVRSFDGLVSLFQRWGGSVNAKVAILLPQADCFDSENWGERVNQQLSRAPQLLRAAGLKITVVDESGLFVDERGIARTTETGESVDVVFFATTALGLFENSERLLREWSYLTGPNVGHAPLLMPICALAMEKGFLPALTKHFGNQHPGVHIPPIDFPKYENAAHYRFEKDRYVLKRAFADKHTYVGKETPGRLWNSAIEPTLGKKDYVIQEFTMMPTAVVPTLVDDKYIEWIEVATEISPFIFDSKYCGAMVRYVPKDSGLVLSPAPQHMGFSLVHSEF